MYIKSSNAQEMTGLAIKIFSSKNKTGFKHSDFFNQGYNHRFVPVSSILWAYYSLFKEFPILTDEYSSM